MGGAGLALGDGQANRDAVDKMWPAVTACKKTAEEIEVAFKVFDNRGEGWITIDNFSTMMKCVSEQLTETEYQLALKQAKDCSVGVKNSQGGEMCDISSA